jgi:hypothetical protein
MGFRPRRGQATPPHAAPLLPRSRAVPPPPAAPGPPVRWITCVDDVTTGRLYPLHPGRVVYYMPVQGGGWKAVDTLGRSHQVSTVEDGRIAALTGGAGA